MTSSHIEANEYLSSSEAAVLVGRSPQTIAKWARRGFIVAVNPDGPGVAKYRKEDILHAASNQRRTGRPKKLPADPT